MKTRWMGVAVLLSCGWAALADGGFFPEFAGSAETADQRAVIVHEDGRETIILQTAHDGDGSGFAWVIPTPTRSRRTDITEGDSRLFEDLFWLTEPRAHHYGGGGFTGCGGGAGVQDEQYAGVNVWQQFVVSDYEVSVLSAEDSGDLGVWLNDHGYGMPPTANDVLEHYVAKDWFFIALRIRSPRKENLGAPLAPGDSGYGSKEFKPIRISFDSPEIVFPMRISSVSSVGQVSVLLYVFAEHRVEGANYPTTQVKAGADWSGDDFPGYYKRKFEEALGDVAPRGLVTEYAGRVERWWIEPRRDMIPLDPTRSYFLTRLRTNLSPAAMDEDVLLTAAPSDDEFDVMLAGADTSAEPTRLALCFLLLGVVLFGSRGSRSGPQRAALLALVLVALVV